MAKKTWIKVKRGILEPKHRRKLGSAWFLYFYMLDHTNWEDGIIREWRDEAAAEEMDIPLSTLRNQRRHLENELYIQTIQRSNCLTITITNWTNPREYSGHVYNKVEQKFEGDQKLTPSDGEGYKEGDNEGIQNLTPFLKFHNITYSHDKEQPTDEDLITQFAEISRVGYIPSALQERWGWADILRRLHNSGVTDEMMARACEGRNITHPAQILSDCSKLLQETP
jgi:hypothetical protein